MFLINSIVSMETAAPLDTSDRVSSKVHGISTLIQGAPHRVTAILVAVTSLPSLTTIRMAFYPSMDGRGCTRKQVLSVVDIDAVLY